MKRISVEKAKKSAETLTAVTAAGVSAYRGYQRVKQWVRPEVEDYSVAIDDSQDLYWEFQRWLLTQIPKGAIKTYGVGKKRNRRKSHSEDVSPDGAHPKRIDIFPNVTKSQIVHIEGHKLTVTTEEPKKKSEATAVDSDFTQFKEFFSKRSEVIYLISKTEEGLQAALRLLDRLAKGLEAEETVRCRVMTTYGWRYLPESPLRPIGSVVLKSGLIEKIVEDFERFLALEARYVEIGLPWHRGYLFYGPPGTGKTSLAKVLASHFKLDLYYISLSDLNKDTELIGNLSEITTGGILVIEDIDIASAATDRDDDRKGVTLSALLNALDGIVTPHGLITIMTTNDISALDPALIRPGRADLKIEIEHIKDEDHLNRMAEVLTGRPLTTRLAAPQGMSIQPALLVETVKLFLHDPDRVEERLHQYVSGYTPTKKEQQ